MPQKIQHHQLFQVVWLFFFHFTAPTPKASEPVKTNVIKERPLSSGAYDRKATQINHRNVEKMVSQETRQNYTKDHRTKVQQTQTTEKNRNLVTKKGQKKK